MSLAPYAPIELPLYILNSKFYYKFKSSLIKFFN
jgi:hypothetical protein